MAMDFLVTGFRQAIQDLLVPEIRVVQTELRNQGERLDNLTQDMEKRFHEVNARFEAVDRRFEVLQSAMDKRFEAMQQEMDKRFGSIQQEMGRRFDENHKEIMALAQSNANANGKLDMVLNQMTDYKEALKVSVRIDYLENTVRLLQQQVAGRS